MINKLKELRNTGSEEGFTLIELMIVVVIIGILAAVAIPVFMNQQKGAIAAGVKSDVKNINTNIVTYLVKAPTDTALTGTWAAGASTTQDATSAAKYKMVRSDTATAIAVTGGWDNYTILGTNTGVAPVATSAEVTTGTATGKFGVLYSNLTGQTKTLGG